MSTAVFGAPEWRARSGRSVRPSETGELFFGHLRGYLAPDAVMDAEEYFQAREDARRGRWRWSLNPDYVVYPRQASEVEPRPGVRVVDESSGRSRDVGREVLDACDATVSVFGRTAIAYFAAHPEPKPWQDASQGQIWELDVVGVSNWVAVEAGDSDEPRAVFRDPHTMVTLEVDDPAITAGRRIWPEDAS